MKKCFLIAVIVLMSATQTAQAKSPWPEVRKYILSAADKIGLAFDINDAVSDRIQKKAEKSEKERLERENEVLHKKIERQEKKDTIHICRQCSIRSVDGQSLR